MWNEASIETRHLNGEPPWLFGVPSSSPKLATKTLRPRLTARCYEGGLVHDLFDLADVPKARHWSGSAFGITSSQDWAKRCQKTSQDLWILYGVGLKIVSRQTIGITRRSADWFHRHVARGEGWIADCEDRTFKIHQDTGSHRDSTAMSIHDRWLACV